MKQMKWIISVVLLALLALSACQAAPAAPAEPAAPMAADDSDTPAAPDAEPAGEENTKVTLMVASNDELGDFLVDGRGMTLYMFTKDEPGKSNCDSGCLSAWPPFLASGELVAGDGVDEALLGTASLADGSLIVTYNQMPLYYWAGDTNPGDTKGQNVNNVWFVVSPQGKPIGLPAETNAGSSGYEDPDY